MVRHLGARTSASRNLSDTYARTTHNRAGSAIATTGRPGSSTSIDAPRVAPEQRIKLVPVGAGITRVIFHFGFMETPDMMEGLKLACLEPELRGIDPQNITYYFRRVMVIPSSKASGMAVWRKSLFAMMHLNANLPAAYFGVPPAQVVEVGLEVEI